MLKSAYKLIQEIDRAVDNVEDLTFTVKYGLKVGLTIAVALIEIAGSIDELTRQVKTY